jgi:hypothetical protein
MRTGAATLLLCCILSADAQAASRERGRGRGRRLATTAPAYVSPYLLEYGGQATALTGNCEGATPTGFAFTRATAATCGKLDGSVVSLTSGQPRLTSRGMLREPAATNLILHSRDMSQAAWLKTNASCAKTATGTDAVASSATTCTASAGNATVLQGITASGSRNTSLYLRRRTGTGTVEVTRDGSTWTNVTASVGASWARVNALTHAALAGSVTNPVIGVRLGTSGDAVDIDRVQSESGAVSTSPVDTGGTSATRNADVFTLPTPATLSVSEGCAYVCFEPIWTGNNPYSTSMFVQARVAAPIARLLYAVVTSQLAGAHDGTNTVTTAAAYTAGVNTCFRTSWSVSGNALTVANLTVPSSSSSAFAGFGAFDPSLGVGSNTSGASGLGAYFTALRLHTTPGGCT